MILSQFASHEVAEALPPSTYSSRVGLGGRVAKWLKRAFLPCAGVLQLAHRLNDLITDENRKNILNEYLRRVYHVSDKECQRRVWIRGEGPECDDFDETCCHFFDDGDPVLENYKDFWITDGQYQVLKKFRDKFRIFSDDAYCPLKFIDTPEWDEITEMAKEVLKAFDWQDTDSGQPQERDQSENQPPEQTNE